jgi:protein-S-isoprenylcysteine O-methyltransferase Ste14
MDRGSILRVWLPLLAGLYVLGYLYGFMPGPHDWMRGAGVGLGLLGLAGVISARATLGRSFSVAPRARQLVTTGIYSKIRNPIYVFSGLCVTGIFLIVRKPHLWYLLLVLIPVQTIRARQEARVLEAAFGDAYREYRKRTWF